MAQLPKITYTLNGATHPAGAKTLGLADVTLITEKEEGHQFYRTKWQGDITFTGKDFKLFWQASQKTCCQKIGIKLYRKGCQGTDPKPWEGFFNLSDLDFNVDECSAKLTQVPRPDDGYQTLFDNWETQINWMQIDPDQPIYSADRKILYRRGRSLVRVLAELTRLTLQYTPAASIIPSAGSDTISVFLENFYNPVDRQPNILYQAVCLQASDVTAPGKPTGPIPSTGFATKADFSLKELVEDLREMFCLYPFLDPDTGKLRWEHESFFPGLTYSPPAVVYSLPKEDPAWNGKRTLQTNVEDLYGSYTLTIDPNQSLAPGDASDPDKAVGSENQAKIPLDFNVGRIDFTNECVTRTSAQSPLTQTRSVRRIATHIDASRWNEQGVDKANWMFLVLSEASKDPLDSTPQIPLRKTDTFGLVYENGDLSASSLIRRFHRHNKPFAAGITNRDASYLPSGHFLGMLSIAPVRRLGSVTIPYCCGDDAVRLDGLIETWLADDGILIRAEHKVAQELLTLDIAHPGPCQVAPPEPFPPTQTPGNCKPRGTYLRSEKRPVYSLGGNLGIDLICSEYRNDVFADGNCGEYVVETQIFTGLC